MDIWINLSKYPSRVPFSTTFIHLSINLSRLLWIVYAMSLHLDRFFKTFHTKPKLNQFKPNFEYK